MTLTRLDLLRMQYSTPVAVDADLRVPDGWVPLLDQYLDAVSGALAAGTLRNAFVLRAARQRGCDLERVEEVGWTLPATVRRRIDEACLRTCAVCGAPGECREVGGTLLVACEAHAQGLPTVRRTGDTK